jgi:diguanylate cyclase (GGDEF)-like protein
MTVRNFLHSYRNIFVFVAGIFLLFELLVVVGLHYSKKSDLREYLHAESLEAQIHTKMALLQMGHIANIFYDRDINRADIKHLMYEAAHTKEKVKHDALRKELYKKLYESYIYFQGHGVRQLHFHLPHAISFLRFHKPQKYGDSLWNVRESIVYVNKYKKPLSCYEEGRIFNGFRNLFPLFYKGEFVGSVEVSYSFSALQKHLMEIDTTSYMFLVNKSVAMQKLFKEEYKLHYQESEFKDFLYDKATLQEAMEIPFKELFAINKKIAAEVNEKLQKGELFSLCFADENILNAKEMLVTFVPVKNIQSKVVAYIVHYKFDTSLELLLRKTDMLLIVLSATSLLVAVIVALLLIYSKKEKDAIKLQATHDALTNIYNRYGINEILRQKFYEFQRYKDSFSIIFCDIDFFKKVNDTYGHDVGDLVLQQIANIVSVELRSSDAFGRWGGEEFIIVLPKTDIKEAYSVAQKLQKAIQKADFPQVRRVTCSFGVVSIQEGDTLQTLLKRVDEYLYQAKESGRNRVFSGDILK